MIKRKTLLVASHNTGKIKEFKGLLPAYDVFSLSDLNIHDDIVEDADSFEGNALIKLRYLAKLHPEMSIIADDSGLCVEALNGEPGVYSARYSGKKGDAKANNELLLQNLHGKENRAAYFICVIALYHNGLEYLFEGRVHGKL
ncbi:MAG: non-canonical purine NTP pyrophosphatase, partial [Luteibaculum sp.]